jgi:hypothetical protein
VPVTDYVLVEKYDSRTASAARCRDCEREWRSMDAVRRVHGAVCPLCSGDNIGPKYLEAHDVCEHGNRRRDCCLGAR